MRTMPTRLAVSLRVLFWVSLGLSHQACSPVEFGQDDKETVSVAPDGNQAAGNPDGSNSDPNGATSPGAGSASGDEATPGGGSTPGSTTPKISVVSPLCMPNSTCQVEFHLNAAAASELRFNWATDDQKYLNASPSSDYIYGVPNVHYVPKSGTVVFAPGETLKVIEVQNINQTNTAMRLFVVVSDCMYAASSVSCTELFPK